MNKALNNWEDQVAECQQMKQRHEKALADRDIAHEREKKLLQKLLKEADKELKLVQSSPAKRPERQVNETFGKPIP